METPWLDDMHRELVANIKREALVTLKVAVCKAGKLSRQDMLDQLGITDTEAKMAELRIASIVSGWREV